MDRWIAVNLTVRSIFENELVVEFRKMVTTLKVRISDLLSSVVTAYVFVWISCILNLVARALTFLCFYYGTKV
jgi:hypothetical protein